MEFLTEYLIEGHGTITESVYDQACDISIPLVLEKLGGHPILYFGEADILRLDLENFNIRRNVEILGEDIKYKQIYVFYIRDEIKLSMPAWSILEAFIDKNKNLNFIVIPILIDIEDSPNAHVSALIIDKNERKAYNFDPNGNPNNGLRDVDFMDIYLSSNCLDHLFLEYFEETGYQYKSTEKITLDKGINSRFYLKFDRGNCGSWVILFALMILSSEEKSLTKLYQQLSSLKWHERGFLIYNFINDYLTRYLDS